MRPGRHIFLGSGGRSWGASTPPGTSEPPGDVTHPVATMEALRALDVSTGSVAYVEENERTYDLVDESTLTWKLIDDTYIIAPDADVSDVTSSPINNNSIAGSYSQLLQPDIVLGTLQLASGAAVFHDRHLHGSKREARFGHTPLVRHTTGELRTFAGAGFQLPAALNEGGSTFVATYKRATGSRRWVMRDWSAWDMSEMGGTPYDPNNEVNFGWLFNWAGQIAEQHPTIKTVRSSDPLGYFGYTEYRPGVTYEGVPEQWSMHFLGNDAAWVWNRHDYDPALGSEIWQMDRLGALLPAAHTQNELEWMRLKNWSLYGNDVNNNGWRGNPEEYVITSQTALVQETDYHVGIAAGAGWAGTGPPEGGGTIYIEGACRIEGFQNNLINVGNTGRYQFVYEDGGVLYGKDVFNATNHGVYGHDTLNGNVVIEGYGADLIFYSNSSELDSLILRNPAAHPLVGRMDFTQLRGGTSPYVGRKTAWKSFDLDLRLGYTGRVIAGVGRHDLDIRAGNIYVDQECSLVHTTGNPSVGNHYFHGNVGPADGQGKINVYVEPTSIGFYLLDGELGTETLTFRNIDVHMPGPGVTNYLVRRSVNRAAFMHLVVRNCDMWDARVNRWFWTTLTESAAGMLIEFDNCRLPRFESEPISNSSGTGLISGLTDPNNLDRVHVVITNSQLRRLPTGTTGNNELYHQWVTLENCVDENEAPVDDRTAAAHA